MIEPTIQPPLLEVERLSVSFPRAQQPQAVVKAISFQHHGGLLALVGESGSGKTMTARALLGLIPHPGQASADTLRFNGQNLLGLSSQEWGRLRGSQIGLVQQDPKYALNPVLTVAHQVEEGLRLHQRTLSKAERRERVEAMLHAVGLDGGKRLLSAYPHQLSGGMGQRVMLAASLICQPKLLIADEPTSSLDQALRSQILDLIAQLASERQMAVLLISHDLPLVAHYCQRALVMHRGQLLEDLPATELPHAQHPYTQMLWRCQPSAATYGQQLPSLASIGSAP